MKINSLEYEYKKRFSIAHELGHTFFYDLNAEMPTKRFLKSNKNYQVEEDYVNNIATTILMPEPNIRETLTKHSLSSSLFTLLKLRDLYKVSQEVLCHQLIRNLGIWDCLVFKSRMVSEDEIQSIGTSIFKGRSFRYWRIPKKINEAGSRTGCPEVIFQNIQSVFLNSRTKFEINEFEFRRNKFVLQSRPLNANYCISLVKKL